MNPPYELGGDERITRFIHHARDFSFTAKLPKVTAFEPDKDGRFSIAEVTGLTREQIWPLARHTLSTSPGRDRVVARAEFPANAATAAELRCIRDDSGFIRHGELLGCNLSDKLKRRDAARKLVEASDGDTPDAPITLEPANPA